MLEFVHFSAPEGVEAREEGGRLGGRQSEGCGVGRGRSVEVGAEGDERDGDGTVSCHFERAAKITLVIVSGGNRRGRTLSKARPR